jgi:hypothetical protein
MFFFFLLSPYLIDVDDLGDIVSYPHRQALRISLIQDLAIRLVYELTVNGAGALRGVSGDLSLHQQDFFTGWHLLSALHDHHLEEVKFGAVYPDLVDGFIGYGPACRIRGSHIRGYLERSDFHHLIVFKQRSLWRCDTPRRYDSECPQRCSYDNRYQELRILHSKPPKIIVCYRSIRLNPHLNGLRVYPP